MGFYICTLSWCLDVFEWDGMRWDGTGRDWDITLV
jgi:hypothetical protein